MKPEPLPARVKVRVKDGREGVIIGPLNKPWDWLVAFPDGHAEGFREEDICVLGIEKDPSS